MQEEIPFYKNEKIKKINIDGNCIIVTKYLNKLYTYNISLPNTTNNLNLIKKDFYITLEEYLLNNKDKYFKSKKTNRKIKFKNILLILFCGLGVYVPFLGLYLLNIYIIYIGILTMALGILNLFHVGNTLLNNTIKSNKEFCETYEKLQRSLNTYLNDKNKNVKICEIKPVKMDKENK